MAGEHTAGVAWAAACRTGMSVTRIASKAKPHGSAQRLPPRPTVWRSPIFPLPFQTSGGSDVFDFVDCGCTVVLWGDRRNARRDRYFTHCPKSLLRSLENECHLP